MNNYRQLQSTLKNDQRNTIRLNSKKEVLQQEYDRIKFSDRLLFSWLCLPFILIAIACIAITAWLPASIIWLLDSIEYKISTMGAIKISNPVPDWIPAHRYR